MSECEHGFDPDEFDQADGAVYCEACIKKWKADSARLAKLNKELLSQPVTLRSVFDYFDDDDVEHRRIELTTYEGPDDERMSDDLYEAIDRLGVDEEPEWSKKYRDDICHNSTTPSSDGGEEAGDD